MEKHSGIVYIGKYRKIRHFSITVFEKLHFSGKIVPKD